MRYVNFNGDEMPQRGRFNLKKNRQALYPVGEKKKKSKPQGALVEQDPLGLGD
jgi:hypothetical protein